MQHEQSGSPRLSTTSPAAAAVEGIRISTEHAAGVITLDRAGALNALTTAMRAEIAAAMPAWARNPTIYAVAIVSATERAFCAGGDVRELAAWGRTHKEDAVASFAAEYALNWILECFTKPTVSLVNGAVMGSGVGISLYGTHRVAGERYRFAMPETGIGLFPDDGVSWTFARMPHEIGMFLALTGRAIGPADAYRLGLVTHCIPAQRFAQIQAALSDADPVDALLDDRHLDPGPGELEAHIPVIARCFSADTVEEIIVRLRAERGVEGTWAEAVVRDLGTRSPTSLKLAHRLVRLARGLDLRETLIRDFRLARRCLDGEDFYEGVRAALIDKDHAPRWRPDRLEDVSEAMVNAYFEPPGAGDLALASRASMQAVAA